MEIIDHIDHSVQFLNAQKTLISQAHGKGVAKTDEFGGSGNGSGNIQTKQLKKQLETAQDDLYKMEKVSGCLKYVLFYTPEGKCARISE